MVLGTAPAGAAVVAAPTGAVVVGAEVGGEQRGVQLLDHPRPSAADQLDQGGRVRDGAVQGDAAEPPPRDRVGDPRHRVS
jgi:hypothetical protein